MSVPQWAAAGVIFACLLGGLWAYAAGDRRVAKGFAALALLGIACLSIGIWGPHAGEHHDDQPGHMRTCKHLKP